MYFNIRDAGSREKEAVFEQIIQVSTLIMMEVGGIKD